MINLRFDGIARNETADRNKIRSDITKYLAGKLAKKLKRPGVRVPWSKMKAEDIINWPLDIEFQPIDRMKIKELKALHELAQNDLLDFTSEFLSRFKVTSLDRWTRFLNQLRSDITKYLAGKLAKKLKRPGVRVPWSKMKAGDITNWPSNIEFKPINRLNIKDLETLLKLAKKDVLEFSPDFISGFKITQNHKLDQISQNI
jgi:hypothetical protein